MKFIYQEKPIVVDILEDDTIETIRYTLSTLLGDDVYLFGKKYVSYTSKQVYDRLIRLFGTIPSFHLRNFFLCFNQAPPVLEKKEYTLEDLDAFTFEGWMDIPIGQIMPCAANPEKVENIDEYEHVPIDQEFRKLLLDYTPLLDDTIYVCKRYPLPLYFLPTTVSKQEVTKVFSLPTPEPSVKGITYVVCRLDPLEPIVMPLDTLFQRLHVSDEIKMIQYHPGKEENILYKLFTVQEDLHGNKIPVLPVQEVIKHGQSYKHTVTVFFQDVKYAFHENGSILFECQSKKPLSINEIDTLFHSHDNLLDQVSSFMYTSGYIYPTFESIQQTTILDMTYKIEFLVKKITPHNCSSLFFINIGASHRYRRVSEFYEGELIQEICVADYLTGRITPATTTKKIKDMFHLTQEQAAKVVEESYQSIASLLADKKRITVNHKVGFPTTIVKSATDISITMEKIPSLQYLPCLNRNMKAYIALLTVPNTISCQEEEVVIVKQPVRRRYDEEQEEPEEPETLDVEYEDEPLEIEYEGGGKDRDLIVNNPNFTIYRMEKSNHTYEGYTRDCPLTRRPIALLTEEEIQKAKTFPTYVYDKVPYICPMYWDIEEKTPLTQKEVDELVKKGKRIIDPSIKGEIDPVRDGSIFKMNDGSHPFPGPLKEKGVCCFKKEHVSKKETRGIVESKQYINTHPTSLAEEGKVSYLPKPLRSFFQLTEDCQLEPNNYLLRYGVAKPNTFLNCIEACWNVQYPGKFTHATFLSTLLKVAKQKFSIAQNSNVIRQYETFEAFEREFLKEKMDYTELWDIISETMAVNLVIVRVPDQIHVEFICPVKKINKEHKLMLMILEHTVQGKICFEPIIEHNVGQNKHTVIYPYYHKKLQFAFDQIIAIYAQCTSESEEFRSNLMASLIYAELPKDTRQVIHSHKCIGFSVDNVFIPCYPSTPLSIFATSMPTSSYEHTLFVLNHYSDKIPCKPLYKIVEGTIKGVLTETHSFVPCIPEPDHSTSLPLYPYRVNHEYMNLSSKIDTDRVDHQLISKAEDYLFSTCRRFLKEKMRNRVLRKQLNIAIAKKEVGIELLERILPVQWVDKMDHDFLKELIRCKGYCSASDKLILPRYNLKTGEPNHYFARLANELNHYSRISTFVVKPQLRMETIPFFVEKQEVILVHSMVEDYYRDLTEAKRIPSNYDTSNVDVQVKVYFKVKKIEYIIIP
jgi:hypothetical protein